MEQLKKVFASANKSIIKWSHKHYWVMYGFGMLILFSAVTPLVLMTLLTLWGFPHWSLGVAAPSALILVFIGFKTCMSAVFRFSFAK